MKRVLVADDEDAIRRLIRSQLERGGFEVVEARNGVDAIELLRSERFDLALIDLMMPIASGYRVLDFIRSERPDTPSVIVTAAGEVGLGILPEGTMILHKPFDAAELLKMVQSLTAVDVAAGDGSAV